MKPLIILVFLIAINLTGYAQERKTITMPYKDGSLTFQYYEKDGMKIPDGPMEFTKGTYTEKGDNKDGFRDGTWIVNKADGITTTIEYTYSKGMLEGPTSIKHTAKDKSHLKYCGPDATYNFHQGRLIGENKVVHSRDTIYCNFGENGKRIGTWKLVDPERTRIIEYNDNPDKQIAYEVDVLGQKQQLEVGSVEMTLIMDFLFFDKIFREIPGELRYKTRPELPTLCDNKYGYLDAWVKVEED